MARSASPRFQDRRVEDVFRAYPKAERRRLMDLRRLIFETAATTPGVGAIEETLKWGQPSYLTPETGSGSTIRIDQVRGAPGRIAMYLNCNSKLAETFGELYPDALRNDGKRALYFDDADAVAEAPLRHCVALALTYHLRKRRQGK